jgi:hypothetical protein
MSKEVEISAIRLHAALVEDFKTLVDKTTAAVNAGAGGRLRRFSQTRRKRDGQG